MQFSEPIDEQLLARIGRGEEAAFLAVYRRRQMPIYRYALHMCRCPETAADVVQETFLELLRQSEKLDAQNGAVLAWLFAVARKQVLRRLTASQRVVSLEDEGIGEPVAMPEFDIDLGQKQLLEKLREVVDSLPFLYREVVVLCDVQGLSYDDAAKVLECPGGTIRSRLHRGRAMVAEKMEPVVRSTR